MVPKKGLEPPHPCEYMDLNHARLPIPPLRPVFQRLAGRQKISGSPYSYKDSRCCQHFSQEEKFVREQYADRGGYICNRRTREYSENSILMRSVDTMRTRETEQITMKGFRHDELFTRQSRQYSP